MAAIDRSNLTRAPIVERLDSVGTTWQEWIIPPWVTAIVIQPSAAAWYAFTSGISGATEPADGGASGSTTHKGAIAANAAYVVLLRNPHDRPGTVGLIQNRSVFVAAQSGTVDVSIEWCGA
jgi:hypothetical protein